MAGADETSGADGGLDASDPETEGNGAGMTMGLASSTTPAERAGTLASIAAEMAMKGRRLVMG